MALESTLPLPPGNVHFLGVKAAGAQGRQPYHIHVLIVLEPTGLVQACTGIALPLPYTL